MIAKFKNAINSSRPVLVDFYTEWCIPCKEMPAVLKKVKEELREQVRIIKVDLDKNPNIATKYKIRSVPTLMIFKDREVKWMGMGLHSAEEITKLIKQQIEDSISVDKISKEQNTFYSSIAKYYSDIFPYNPTQLQFVEKQIEGLQGKKILDVGCATGELSFNLAKAGAHVVGVDLNDDLLQQAKSKNHPRLTFKQVNMLEVDKNFTKNQFDAVLCFGNTLVHLQSEKQIEQMFNAIKKVIKPNGTLLLQILNYDYIFENKIEKLPEIETNNIRFIRKYNFARNTRNICFNTDLYLKGSDKIVSNTTCLLALGSKTLVRLLKDAGFQDITLFANFKQDNFKGKHIPLVLHCKNNTNKQ